MSDCGAVCRSWALAMESGTGRIVRSELTIIPARTGHPAGTGHRVAGRWGDVGRRSTAEATCREGHMGTLPRFFQPRRASGPEQEGHRAIVDQADHHMRAETP